MRTYNWPEHPTLPPRGKPALIRIATASPRQTARDEARAVLRTVLADWRGLTPSQLPLMETCSGPAWRNTLSGLTLGISFSYGAEEAWIGLIRGGRLGIDVMRIEPFAESQLVAEDYLGPEAAAMIAGAIDPARMFARLWTIHEAQLKCAGHPLAEWKGPRLLDSVITSLEGPDWVGAVAVSVDGAATAGIQLNSTERVTTDREMKKSKRESTMLRHFFWRGIHSRENAATVFPESEKVVFV